MSPKPEASENARTPELQVPCRAKAQRDPGSMGVAKAVMVDRCPLGGIWSCSLTLGVRISLCLSGKELQKDNKGSYLHMAANSGLNR